FHFAGFESIDDADRLRGLEVQVPLAERAPIGAGRYYISELIGCTVWEQAALASPSSGDDIGLGAGGASGVSPLGTVADVQRISVQGVQGAEGIGEAGGAANSNAKTAESWVLAVATPRGELLIPLAAEICTRIDTAARRIEVRLPAGLAELNETS
ncbi:MAG TPA: hypothetical protein VGG55_05260, partial [Candidatus Acidoferrales bacterium]